MPPTVRATFGAALREVQHGGKPIIARMMHGFGGGSVLELREDYRTDTYRAVYTVRFRGVVYVLHVFQKKSKSGKETPALDLERIAQRLKEAEQDSRTR